MALAENTFDIAVMDFIVYPTLFVSLDLKASGSKKEIGQTSSFFFFFLLKVIFFGLIRVRI